MRAGFGFLCLLLNFVSQITAVGQVPVSIQFIENKNQWPEGIQFGARIAKGTMLIRPGEFDYYFLDQKKLDALHERTHERLGEADLQPIDEPIDGQVVQVRFVGANTLAQPMPEQPLATYYNFFIGADTCSWAPHARAFGALKYKDLYDGIDMAIHSSGDFLKYDLIVGVGADPSSIGIAYTGADVSLQGEDVHVKTPIFSMLEKKPVAFQQINGKRIDVACEYSLGNNIISFCFPNSYDPCYEIVIDPLLIFSTYSGSHADNWGSTATPGENGKLYSSGVTNHFVGSTFSGVFPATAGAFQTTYGGVYDVAILKYDSLGQQLLYASYLGGAASESPHSLVMDANHDLIVLGTTSSSNFPTTAGVIDATFNGGTPEGNVIGYNNGSDIFVAKISADGSQLLSSTFLGGTSNDGLNPTASILSANYGDQLRGDVITDDQGNIFVSSVTSSSDFPVINSFGMTYHGGSTDALVLKLNQNLSQVLWGAFIGGSAADASHTIKFDHSNAIFVAGGTASSNFTTTAGAYQSVNAGGADGWIARLARNGSAILSSTLTGTPGFNQVYFLDLNSSDEVYVYGQTQGAFPVTSGVYSNPNSGQFVQKFSNDLKTLKFSTVFGSGRGIPDISPTAFLVNDCNKLYMSGWGGLVNTTTGHWNGSSTFGMPTTGNAYQRASSGSDFYFMVLTDDASQFLYGTYLGGNFSRTHVDGGTSRFDKSGVVYHSVCSGCQSSNPAGGPTSDFPTTPNAWSRTNNSKNCNNAAFKFDLSLLHARIQTNSADLHMPGLSSVCISDKIVFQNMSTGGQYFEWSMGDGTVLVRPDTSAFVHKYAAPGQYTVKLKALDNGTCIGKDSTYAVINVYVAQGQAGPNQTICAGSSTQLQASGGASYTWTDKEKKFAATVAAPIVSPVDSTEYYVTIRDGHGCVTRDTVVVRVVPGMELDLEVARLHDCNSRPMVKVRNLTDSTLKTHIDFGDGFTSTQSQELHKYESDGNFAVGVVGTRGFCVFSKQVVLPFFTLFVPNVITPGGSTGYNDVFKIRYGSRSVSDAGIKAAVVIYNRWGNKVYENSDYKDNWGAEGVGPGVYYYEVAIEGETVCRSWLEVIK
jgi:hypothetical protein